MLKLSKKYLLDRPCHFNRGGGSLFLSDTKQMSILTVVSSIHYRVSGFLCHFLSLKLQLSVLHDFICCLHMTTVR